MAVTILELAKHRGAEEVEGSINGAEFEKVGLPIMGGCEICGATIAAYNACPTRTGYLRCNREECLGYEGFENVEEADRFIFPEEYKDDKKTTEEIMGLPPLSESDDWKDMYEVITRYRCGFYTEREFIVRLLEAIEVPSVIVEVADHVYRQKEKECECGYRKDGEDGKE